MRPALVLACTATAALATTGCESTQSRSARLEKESKATLQGQKGVAVAGRSNPDVKIGRPAIVRDENGTAVAVELRLRGPRPLGRVPLAVTLQDGAGARVGGNDAPGLDPSLTSIPAIPDGGPVVWVNDQLQATAAASVAEVKAGKATRLSGALPELDVTSHGLEQDPTSGVSAVGDVINRSQVEQRNLVVTAVARKGRKVVAAGRGQVPRLRPGQTVAYQVFFIGDPTGARLDVSVLPTALK